MKKLTSKEVRKYVMWRSDSELAHCPDCIAAACNDLCEEYNNRSGVFIKVKAKDFMTLLFFNDPIPGLMTHSYGFNTAHGRHIIEVLKEKYYEYKN